MVGKFDDTKCPQSLFQKGSGSENDMTTHLGPYGKEYFPPEDVYAVDGILYTPPLEQQGQVDIFHGAIQQALALKMHKQSPLPEQF